MAPLPCGGTGAEDVTEIAIGFGLLSAICITRSTHRRQTACAALSLLGRGAEGNPAQQLINCEWGIPCFIKLSRVLLLLLWCS